MIVPPEHEDPLKDRLEQEVETDNMTIKNYELELSTSFFDAIRAENKAEGDLLHSEYCKFMYEHLVGSSGASKGQRYGIEELVREICPEYKQKRKSDKSISILRSIAKVFLEELLEEAVELREQMGQPSLTCEVLREAFRRYENRKGLFPGGNQINLPS